jgi:hypothetical protein
VLIATAAFWRGQVWKYRSKEWRCKEQAQSERLDSLAHVTANGLNAIRANLVGFREAGSLPSAGDHMKQVEQALERIDAALEKPQVAAQAKPGKNLKAVA